MDRYPFKPVDTIGVADEPPDAAEILADVLKGIALDVTMQREDGCGLRLTVTLAAKADIAKCEKVLFGNVQMHAVHQEYPRAEITFSFPRPVRRKRMRDMLAAD